MKFRSCFNIFEDGELLEDQPLPTDDIDFFEEEIDVIVEDENEQLRYQISKHLNTDENDIIIK